MKYYYTGIRRGSYYFAKVYHYDETGNKEIIDYEGTTPNPLKEAAEDDAADWCEENNIDAEME